MTPREFGNRGTLRLHVGAYSAVLGLLFLLSWLGGGWGYLVLYGLVLATFAVVVAAVSLGLARGSRTRGTSRASAFLERSLRSFAYAQTTLVVALVATATLARLTSGPLGPYPGGAFEGVPSEEPFEEDLVLERDEEIQLQIPADPPYTITTHAFLIDRALYVGADFVLPFKRWIYIVQEDPEVLVRIGGRLFRRRAVRIEDPVESRRILEEISRQRGVDPDDWLTEVWFFRMDLPS
ncbi:MAG: hypothetical protein ABFS46_01155 [Myxococcota bacterium]